MTKASRQPMLLGTALMFLAAGTLFGCKDSFLTDAAAAQGVLDQSVLANAAGVEGNLIATYRSLDYNNGAGGDFCTSVSNWCFASVPSDDAYKGTESTDQPQAASVPTEIRVSMVAAPWRRFCQAALWNGQPAHSTTGVASWSESHCQ